MSKLLKVTLICRDLTSVNLDEYIGLSGENPQSYRYFMQEHLFNQSLLKKAFYQMVLLRTRNAEGETSHQILVEHPVDLQILGIGTNGHIGFNEQGTSFDGTVHVVDLDNQLLKRMLVSLIK